MGYRLVKRAARLCLMLMFISAIFSTWGQADVQPATEAIELASIDYPPLMGGSHTILAELATAAFAAVGVKVTHRIYALPRVVRAVSTNAVAGALGSHDWFHYDDSKTHISHTRIYLVSLRLFYLKSRFPEGLEYQTLSDLRDYNIGYIRGGALLPLFARENVQPHLVRTLHQNVEKLYAGRDDIFVATELGGWAVIREHFPGQINQFSQASKPLLIDGGDIIFSGKYKHLDESFRLGFKMIKANGEYLKIIQKYYGQQPIPAYLMDFIKQP